jgi:anti-sigma B factor antagonist
MPSKQKRPPFAAARSDDALYVRVHGLGSMTNAPTLETFADRAIDEGVTSFVFDFRSCTGVDSTFMGLILGLSNRLREDEDDGGIVLINVDDHAKKQLSSVGVDAFVTLKPGKTRLPKKLRLTEVSVVETSDRERLKVMMRAHKELVTADARNKAKFGLFLEAIVAELG